MKLYICMIIALCAGQSFANLIQNGSFEEGVSLSGTFTTLTAGTSTYDDITNWEITSGSVDYINSYWQAEDGYRSLDMSGLVAGSISQDFTTVIGQEYKVTFNMSGNPDGGSSRDITKTLLVSATGAESASFDYVTSSNTLNNMLWQEMTWYFTATSESTTLAFSSLESNAFGPALDNVNVSLVPVPATILLGFLGLGIGGWKLRKSL